MTIPNIEPAPETTREKPDPAKIVPLHALYNELVGDRLPIYPEQWGQWLEWLQRGMTEEPGRGWTEDDLRLVVAYIKRKIQYRERFKQSLRLYKLLDPERFRYDLKDARDEVRRHPKPLTPRDKALASTGRTAAQTSTAKTPAQIMEDSKAFAQFKAWREANNL